MEQKLKNLQLFDIDYPRTRFIGWTIIAIFGSGFFYIGMRTNDLGAITIYLPVAIFIILFLVALNELRTKPKIALVNRVVHVPYDHKSDFKLTKLPVDSFQIKYTDCSVAEVRFCFSISNIKKIYIMPFKEAEKTLVINTGDKDIDIITSDMRGYYAYRDSGICIILKKLVESYGAAGDKYASREMKLQKKKLSNVLIFLSLKNQDEFLSTIKEKMKKS